MPIIRRPNGMRQLNAIANDIGREQRLYELWKRGEWTNMMPREVYVQLLAQHRFPIDEHLDTFI